MSVILLLLQALTVTSRVDSVVVYPHQVLVVRTASVTVSVVAPVPVIPVTRMRLWSAGSGMVNPCTVAAATVVKLYLRR